MIDLTAILALSAASAALTYFTGGLRSFLNPIFWFGLFILTSGILLRTGFDNMLTNYHEIDLENASPYLGAVAVGVALVCIINLLIDGFAELRDRKVRREAELPTHFQTPAADTGRPWDGLPPEARQALRSPGDLGPYEQEGDLPPLRFVTNA
jgi:hypothetical protein